jgi:hypothetical protein
MYGGGGGGKLLCEIEGRIEAEGVWEEGAQYQIWI